MEQPFDFSGIKSEDRKDILELSERIQNFVSGVEDEERFKHYRLTRGVYGQRQLGVQMFRTKIPYGKITTDQLVALANISDKYATGNLHITTRQNIQLHFVKLKDAPAVWTEMAAAGLTAREACGNTVRNITASPKAGIDPHEPFDVSPYAHAAFEFFLRNPICQDMGRKIKPAFSSSELDSAYTYFHDFGFIPKIKIEDGKEIRGFKVLLGGGLGAVSIVAHVAYEFLPADQIIPFMEACIRVFDRYGEREKRMKARLKFLVKNIGFESFMDLVEVERIALKYKSVPIDPADFPDTEILVSKDIPTEAPVNPEKFEFWVKTNVFEQKQKNWYAAQLKVELGDLHSDKARLLAAIAKLYAADDIRLTVNQGLILKFIQKEHLPNLFNALDKLGLAEPGFDSTADITACPGTDTCALGVTNSTGLAKILENVIRNEFPNLVSEQFLKIKISGCMNSCGQHMAANIGFHGSSIKKDQKVVPAMQVVIGGGIDPEGKGFIAEKIIKLPTKRIPQALSTVLRDFEEHASEETYFNDYFYEKGKMYFYDLLKSLADINTLEDTDYFDWGQDSQYIQEIGVGECAGVALDVVGAILSDATQKIALAEETLVEAHPADSVYHSYTAMIIGAKALLLSDDVKCNTHKGILDDFQKHFVEQGLFPGWEDFSNLVLQINQQEPSAEFATSYLEMAKKLVSQIIATRKKQLANEEDDKQVIGNYYRA